MNELLDKKEVLTREEVMALLRIGRNTFYKLIHQGMLRGYKEGNRFKVLSTSVNEYIAGRMN
jgi:excisionase family DNA binding protein